MKAVKPLLGTFMLSLCAIAFSAQSQTSMPATPSSSNATSSTAVPGAIGTMTKEQIEAKYAMDKKECMSMNGNAKDMCMKKAEDDNDMAWKKIDPQHNKQH